MAFQFGGKTGYRVKNLNRGSFAAKMYKKGVIRGQYVAAYKIKRSLRKPKFYDGKKMKYVY